MENLPIPIPVGLIETALNSKHAAALLSGHDTHMPALHLVGELVLFTQDSSWIAKIVAGFLPPEYAGNTLDEIPRMIADSIKKGFDKPKDSSKPPSAAETALNLMREVNIELFHTPQNVGYAAMTRHGQGTICYPVRSEAMKGHIRLTYHARTGKTIGRDALSEALDLMEAKAVYESPEEQVYVRVAGSSQEIFYDLGQPDGSVVKVTAAGWQIVQDGYPRFHRPAGFSIQVVPNATGTLAQLRDLLHLDLKNWVLLLAFLIISLKPTHPYMVLLLSGGHGSGKSKISELIKRIIDPHALEKFRLPKDEHTLAIQASQAWMLVYDNTSAVKWNLSDAICAMLTGGGFSTRKFYADDDLRMFKNARPAIINGIGEFASQHDLLDRAIAVQLPPMPKDTRLTEREINSRFEAILPGVIAELLGIVSTALRRFDEIEAPTTVRMADAAQWLMAAEPATGLPEGTFLRALEESVKEVTIDNTVNNPLVIALFKLLNASGPERRYEGTVGELHDKLRDDYGRIDPQLPQTPSHLSNALQRLAHGMAEIGLMVDLQQRTNRARPLSIWIVSTEYTPEPSEMLKRLY